MQLSIFDIPKAERDEGMRRAELGANSEWKHRVTAVIYRICLHNDLFTSDDIVEELDKFNERTPDMRALGPMITKASRIGYCQPTDRVIPSRNRRYHARPIRVWQSLIFPVTHETRH